MSTPLSDNTLAFNSCKCELGGGRCSHPEGSKGPVLGAYVPSQGIHHLFALSGGVYGMHELQLKLLVPRLCLLCLVTFELT